MASGRFELDEYGRQHFRPFVPALPRIDDVVDTLAPASDALATFDGELRGFASKGLSGRLFARLDAVHSAGAEGSTTTFTELMDFAVKPGSVASPMEAEEVAASADAFEQLAPAAIDPVEAALQLHKQLFEKATDRFKAESAGQLKTRPNATWDETQPDGWFRYTLPATLPDVLDEWRRFTSEQSLMVPELVRQACSHWMFEHIHPVQDGNGRVGRLLVPLMLHWKGTTKTACAFLGEAVHENKDRYIDGLKASRISADMTPFTRIFLGFVRENAARNTHRLQQIQSLLNDWGGAVGPLRTDSVIHRLLPWIASHPTFSARMVADELAVSFATANDAIKRLITLSILEPSNDDGRNRVFRVPAVLDIFDRFRKPKT